MQQVNCKHLRQHGINMKDCTVVEVLKFLSQGVLSASGNVKQKETLQSRNSI